jgi:hypothetical protein
VSFVALVISCDQEDSRSRIQGLEFRVKDLGFRVQGLGFKGRRNKMEQREGWRNGRRDRGKRREGQEKDGRLGRDKLRETGRK